MHDSNRLCARNDQSSKSSNNSVRFIIHNWISSLFGCSPTQGSRLSLPSCKPSVHSYDNYHTNIYANWNYIRQSVSQYFMCHIKCILHSLVPSLYVCGLGMRLGRGLLISSIHLQGKLTTNQTLPVTCCDASSTNYTLQIAFSLYICYLTLLARYLKSSEHVILPYLQSDFLCWSKQCVTTLDSCRGRQNDIVQ